MNIFKILANGDGTINEANVSAFLGYLLDPYADHGLGFEFLERVVAKLDIEDFNTRKYEYEVLFEQAFKEENKSKQIVDIVILCYEDNKGNFKESRAKDIYLNDRKLKNIFLLENKVNNGSKKKGQIKNQFSSTVSSLKLDSKLVYSIYLTPEDDNYSNEFKSFLETENKTHLVWKNKISDNDSIYNILKELIENESKGIIEAINEYTKHTIKSFIMFIENDFKSEKQEEKERKNDGTYTQKFIDLNKETDIENKLNKLKQEIKSKNSELSCFLSDVKLNEPRFPKLIISINDILIEIHAGSLTRDSISIIFRVNPEIFETSKSKLITIAEKLSIDIKMSKSKQAYCRTKEMKEQISIKDYDLIYEAVLYAIQLSK